MPAEYSTVEKETTKAERLVTEIHTTEDMVLGRLRSLMLRIRGEQKTPVECDADRPEVSLADLLDGYGEDGLREFREHACQLIGEIGDVLF